MDKLIRGIDSLGPKILEKKIQDSLDDKKYEKSVGRRCPSNIIFLESYSVGGRGEVQPMI